MDHPFRKNVVAFDNVHEMQLAPLKMQVDDIIQWGAMRQQFLHREGILVPMTQLKDMESNECLNFLSWSIGRYIGGKPKLY